METPSRIAKVVTKLNLRQRRSDFAYWQTQPYEARLATLEQIRREYHLWKYGSEPKFETVCRIVKRREL